MSESKSASELILEGRWAVGQVTGEPSGQIRELGLMKGRSKGMGQAGQYGQMSISLQPEFCLLGMTEFSDSSISHVAV